MNVRLVRFIFVAAALILLGVVSAQAQTPTVNIKFKFQANGRLLEAGTYSVDFGANGNVMLTPAKGGAVVEVAKQKALGGRNVKKVELVFDRVGSLLFLSEVWLPGPGGPEVVEGERGGPVVRLARPREAVSYSFLRAWLGSIAIARRAGTSTARVATASSTAMPAAAAVGSCASRP
jgi:hypothetical protein